MKKLEEILEWGGLKKDTFLLVISGLALLLSILGVSSAAFDPAWIVILCCGIPIILEAVIGLVTAFDIRADVLVSIALIASVCIGEDFAAGEVAFIMQLGGLLEELTVARARAGIENLVRLAPLTARIVREGEEETVRAEEVCAGDVLRVLPGETVPADGIILTGQTAIDQSVMTGESLPVDKGEGDEVFSGTVNQFGAFDMEARRVGEDSSIKRLVRLAQSADAGKAKIVRLADRFATWVVVAALAAAVLTWLISGEIIRAVTILVVFCPCSLVLATPTAIMAAIGNVTKKGFLVREGDALERLAGVEVAAFDKTGTLTFGTPAVCKIGVVAEGLSEEAFCSLVSGAEARSEHPLGKAVIRYWVSSYSGKACGNAEDFTMFAGLGIRALVDGREVLAGDRAFLDAKGIDAAQTWEERQCMEEGCAMIYVAVDRMYAGFLALSDIVRPDAKRAIESLSGAGVTPVLLTGDHANAARYIAGAVGIRDFKAECRPEDKLSWIRGEQEEGRMVCMVGDGINDAPALRAACVGIAMGRIGSDIAADASDIVLVNDNLNGLGHLLRISKQMMRTIRFNLAFSMTLNFVAVFLAITGILNPVIGALVHNAGSVVVIVHSAFLLTWREKE